MYDLADDSICLMLIDFPVSPKEGCTEAGWDRCCFVEERRVVWVGMRC